LVVLNTCIDFIFINLKIVRQTKMQTDEPLVYEPGPSEVEVAKN